MEGTSHGPRESRPVEIGWDPGGPSSIASPDAMAVAIANSWLARSLVKGKEAPATAGYDGCIVPGSLHAPMEEMPGKDPASATMFHKACGGGEVIHGAPVQGPLDPPTPCGMPWLAAHLRSFLA